jgi:hypothetical protein
MLLKHLFFMMALWWSLLILQATRGEQGATLGELPLAAGDSLSSLVLFTSQDSIAFDPAEEHWQPKLLRKDDSMCAKHTWLL